ncbi:MAG TPA: S9 family peptidase [Aggregatilineales bacterium]|nr:S9 family peptidase [Aggregatilineales bacterium]
MSVTKRPLNIDDLLHIIDVEDPQVSPDGRWIAYVQRSIDALENRYRTAIYVVATDGGESVRITQGGSDSQPRWSPDGARLAFTSARGGKPQIYLIRMGIPGGEAYALTRQPNGATSPVWSPDGAHLAFLSPLDAAERAREDAGEVDAPPADRFEAQQRKENAARAEAKRYDPMIVERIPYRDGYGKTYLDGRFQQIHVIPASGGESRRLTGLDANYSAPVWSPDGASLLTFRPSDPDADEPSRLDRLYRIALTDGAETVVYEDVTADRLPALSPDGQRIAYIRTPLELQYTRVPLLSVLDAGGAPRDLTLAFDRSATDPAWSPDGASVYFRAQNEGNTALYRIAPDGGTVDTVISAADGSFIEVQAYHVGKTGGIACVAATPDVPGELFYLAPGASAPVKLTDVNRALLDTVIVQPTVEVRFLSYDGASVQGWYIPPVNAQAGTPAPLIVHIHGGPRIMANPASKMWHEWQLYAARGYGVFFCNAHSSDGYGQEFQRLAYGEPDFPDHMAGVDTLIARGLADPDRLLVTGGSYGGYMTAWVVGHTDRFKAAIAERGVYNLFSQYGTTDFPVPTEHEFDAKPWEVPMQVWERSPLAHAHKITTPLMILHSENDYRCLISEAEQLFNYVRLAGQTPVQMVRFPREGHPLSRNGEPEHRVERLTLMLGWFEKYCPA